MNLLTKSYHVLRHLGPGFVARRVALSLTKKLGITRRRFAPLPWSTIELDAILAEGVPRDPSSYAEYKQTHLPSFLFPFGVPPVLPDSITQAAGERSPNLRERIELLAANRCVYFFHQPSPEPIDWYHNPFEDTHGERNKVWCDIPDFDPVQGDPRVMWEPSRAAWALDLARGRARQWPEATPELFWRWVDSWMDACPPFDGFQWKCGQESTVRFLAIITGFWAFGVSQSDAAARWTQMTRLAWATGYRVLQHIGYAVSQNNNHALSEACGLMLIAQLFPELRDAPTWDRVGREILDVAMRRQIYPDGSYVQHSMNYHRVMLQICTLALRVAELGGRPMRRDRYERLVGAADFLFQMTDDTTGRTPNYGNNDGAWVLPFSETHFSDHRGAIQSAHYLVHHKLPLPPGVWDEEALWLHGVEAVAAARSAEVRASRTYTSGGYYTLRRRESWVMIRCHTYRDRPSQYDPLHLDLWWKGTNILCDRGTYRYYCPGDPGLEDGFRSPAAHNTVEIDGAAPVEWIGRFLFAPFPRAEPSNGVDVASNPPGAVWCGRSLDHARSPWRAVHQRVVIVVSDAVWVIVDDLLGAGAHRVTARWQLPAVPVSICESITGVELRTPGGPAVLRSDTAQGPPVQSRVLCGSREGGRAIGFDAPFYNKLRPSPTFEVNWRGELPLRLVTAVFLGIETSLSGLTLETPTDIRVSAGDRRWALQVPQQTFVGSAAGEIVEIHEL
jgi:hypothetical protein